MSPRPGGRLWRPVALLVVGFLLGAGARELLFVVDFDPPPVYPVEPVTVRVQTAEQLAATRAALVRYLFDGDDLPTDLPVDNGDGTYTVRMPLGFESHVRLIGQATPNGRLVLYHAGHAAYGDVDRPVVEAMVARGYTVLVFDMPLVGVNETPVTFALPNGPVTIATHDNMVYLDDAIPGSAIRLFVQPVVVMLNAFAPRYSDISMIGLSGGGWTTTLAAAIDDRIDRSYPTAGTLPLAVQFSREAAWGDWEQTEPTLYTIADYVDLYVLGAHERRQMQVLNEFDPCCFGGDNRSIYEPQVRAAVAASGGGSFDVYLDRNNRQHSVGADALGAILSDMEHVPAD